MLPYEVPAEDYSLFAAYYYGPGGPWRKTACMLPCCAELLGFVVALVMLSLKKLGMVIEDFWGTEHIFFFVALAVGFGLVPLVRLAVYLFAVCKYRRRHHHKCVVLVCASKCPLIVMDGHVLHPPVQPVMQLYRRDAAWSLVVAYRQQKEKAAATTAEYPVSATEAHRLHAWLGDAQRQPVFRYIGASEKTKIGEGAIKFTNAQLQSTNFQAKFNDCTWPQSA